VRSCIAEGEGGSVILAGHVPIGSRVRFSQMRARDIVHSGGEVASVASREAAGRGMLLYSCAARSWSLGSSNLAELDILRDTIAGRSPYQCVCSGGEIFPQWLPDGRVVNHLQNASLTLCIL